MSAPGEWLDRALCVQTDPEVFFPEQGSPAAAAKQVCQRCPVRGECRAYALATPEKLYGIWGGLSEKERREPRRKLRLAT